MLFFYIVVDLAITSSVWGLFYMPILILVFFPIFYKKLHVSQSYSAYAQTSISVTLRFNQFTLIALYNKNIVVVVVILPHQTRTLLGTRIFVRVELATNCEIRLE